VYTAELLREDLAMGWRDLESFSFGDSPALADELSTLVLDGVKTATFGRRLTGN
jgi:uncharacterized protein YhfF